MRRAWLFAVLAACGRLSFDPRDDASTGSPDTSQLDSTICDDGLPGVLFCEGFEGPPQLTTVEANAPTFVVADSSQVYRGSRSLHAHSTRLGEPAWILGGALPSVTSGELWARWYIYVPASPPQISIASVHILDQIAPNDGVIFGFTDLEIDVSATEPNAYNEVPFSIVRDAWHCVQLHIVIADTGGRVETWFDEMPGPTLVDVDTLPPNGYRNVHAGMWAAANGTTPMDLWTDELVIGTQAIACD